MANDILNKIVDLTQLPSDDVSGELEQMLIRQGYNPENVSLAQLREALAQYLTDVFEAYGLVQTGETDDDSPGGSSVALKIVN